MNDKRLDVRWQQRFANFQKALRELGEAVALAKARPLSKLESQGIIQAFEFTHELAWNVMKDFFKFQGDSLMAGSRDATRAAFKEGIILNGDGWMDMIQSRNLTSHTYQEATAREIAAKIIYEYFPLFEDFEKNLEARLS